MASYLTLLISPSTRLNIGYIETKFASTHQCFALKDDIWFGSYRVPSSIPEALLAKGLHLETGDTNLVNCSAGGYVNLSKDLDASRLRTVGRPRGGLECSS